MSHRCLVYTLFRCGGSRFRDVLCANMIMLRNMMNKSACFYISRYCKFSSTTNINPDRPIIYGDEISPPVRFVLMSASILGIEVNFKKLELFKNEHKTDFFKKINPLQKVPVMVTSHTTICDSHAISLYLCLLAGDRGSDLYPTQPITRARVNQMLFFNSSTLFRLDSEILTAFFAGKWPINKKKVDEWNLCLDYLEYTLENNQWLAGDKMLLCDICAVTVVTSILPLIPMTKRHRKVNYWISQFENVPSYEINKRGLTTLYSYIDLFKNNDDFKK